MAGDHAELTALFDADQAEREGPIDWERLTERDVARQERVFELLAAGEARTADDFYHAAMVFQHGGAVVYYERANELARRAIALDPSHKKARWLVAASEDRALVQRGLPQKWGTQFHVDMSGRWTLSPYDEATTDEERAAWGVPPIEEAHERVRVENAKR